MVNRLSDWESEGEKRNFKEALLGDKLICSKLNEKEIDSALDPKNYLGTAVKQAELFAQD